MSPTGSLPLRNTVPSNWLPLVPYSDSDSDSLNQVVDDFMDEILSEEAMTHASPCAKRLLDFSSPGVHAETLVSTKKSVHKQMCYNDASQPPDVSSLTTLA